MPNGVRGNAANRLVSCGVALPDVRNCQFRDADVTKLAISPAWQSFHTRNEWFRDPVAQTTGRNTPFREVGVHETRCFAEARQLSSAKHSVSLTRYGDCRGSGALVGTPVGTLVGTLVGTFVGTLVGTLFGSSERWSAAGSASPPAKPIVAPRAAAKLRESP